LLTQNSLGRMLPAMGDFGQFVRLKRIEKQLSQRKLAVLAGLSSGAVSMIERGERVDLRADTVSRLARALDMTADEAWRRLDEPEPALSVK